MIEIDNEGKDLVYYSTISPLCPPVLQNMSVTPCQTQGVSSDASNRLISRGSCVAIMHFWTCIPGALNFMRLFWTYPADKELLKELLNAA